MKGTCSSVVRQERQKLRRGKYKQDIEIIYTRWIISSETNLGKKQRSPALMGSFQDSKPSCPRSKFSPRSKLSPSPLSPQPFLSPALNYLFRLGRWLQLRFQSLCSFKQVTKLTLFLAFPARNYKIDYYRNVGNPKLLTIACGNTWDKSKDTDRTGTNLKHPRHQQLKMG